MKTAKRLTLFLTLLGISLMGFVNHTNAGYWQLVKRGSWQQVHHDSGYHDEECSTTVIGTCLAELKDPNENIAEMYLLMHRNTWGGKFSGNVWTGYDTGFGGASHGYSTPTTTYVYKAEITVKLTGEAKEKIKLEIAVEMYYQVSSTKYSVTGQHTFQGKYDSATKTVSTSTMSVKDQLPHVRITLRLTGTYDFFDTGLSEGDFDEIDKIELLTYRIVGW